MCPEAARLDEERVLKARRALRVSCGFKSHRLRSPGEGTRLDEELASKASEAPRASLGFESLAFRF